MITALFAKGPLGEFGFQGKLPWEDYKGELETFYATLNSNKPRVILMGTETYRSLPASVLKAIMEAAAGPDDTGHMLPPSLHVVGRTAPQLAVETHAEGEKPMFLPITSLGSNFKDFYKDTTAMCIGGMALLTSLLKLKAVESMYISTISPPLDVKLKADRSVPPFVLNYDATKLFLSNSQDESGYSHYQELWIL